MGPYCEVCANFRSASAPASESEIVRVELDARAVFLCRGHARIAANSGVETFEQLRELYGSGRRSHLPRRRPPELQPAGETRQAGRRASDAPA